MQIFLDINLENVKYENVEQRHLELLLFIKSASKFFMYASDVLGSKNSNEKMENLFRLLPDDVLKKCGYSKNLNSFDRIDFIIKHILKEDIYTLAVTTESKDLPNTKGLEFLKVNLI